MPLAVHACYLYDKYKRNTMGRRRKSYPHLEAVEIIDMAHDGKAIGKTEEGVVIVERCVPGDVVDVQVNAKKKGVFSGYPTRYVSKSPDRITPICSHFGVCGGCKWQSLSYDKQLQYKQKHVYDCFDRIAKVNIQHRKDIYAAPATEYYRNKMEFSFTDKRWLDENELDTQEKDLRGLGFHVPGRFDKVVDVKHCYLQGGISNDIRNKLKEFAIHKGYTFTNLRSHEGFLRNIFIRNTTKDEVMVFVVFGENNSSQINELMSFLHLNFPEITSLLYAVNTKVNSSIYDLEIRNFAGQDSIYEKMGDLHFKISPKSFYQTNSEQAYELYKIALDLADIQPDETVYDLYTGTGTIANFVSQKAKKVIGVELVADAIADAKENAKLNKIENTHFVVGDMKDVFTPEFVEEHGQADLIIVDPPRAGLHQKVVDELLKQEVPKIVYISCNPATQARDVGLLAKKYQVTHCAPVDMFPHTHHTENIVKLELHQPVLTGANASKTAV